jgi:hypothetical protein
MVMPNGCWEWVRGRTRQGYGKLNRNGKRWAAHRFIWTFVNGPIPNGIHVLHKCDNPPCINPDHLWLGTHTDNMRDKVRKGRLNSYHVKKEHRKTYETARDSKLDSL